MGGGVKRTELGRPLAVGGRAGPIIRPCNISIGPQRNHRLDGEGHARFRFARRLVLCIVRDVGCTVEERVDPMATVRPDGATAPGLRVLLNDVAELPDRGAWLHSLYRQVKAFASRLDHPHRVRISLCLIAYVVRLVQVAVVALMVKCDVEVEDVAVEQYTLVWNTMADDFVRRGADRLGEVIVVKRRGISLFRNGWCQRLGLRCRVRVGLDAP